MYQRILILFLLNCLLNMVLVHAQESSTDASVMSDGLYRDTLIHASSVKELTIKALSSSVSITAKDIDGKGENFYYDTNTSDSPDINKITFTIFKDVTDLTLIEEEGKKLEIFFLESGTNPSYLSFDIPDPENRTVQSYIGHRQMNFGVNLTKKGKSHWSLTSGGLACGWITPVDDNPDLNSSMGRSMEWTWNNIIGVSWSYGNNSITMGIGIDWKNYVIRTGQYFHKGDDGMISLLPFEEGVSKGTSRIRIFSYQIPLLYRLYFGKKGLFTFTAGPIVKLNTSANIKTKYRLDSRDYTVTSYHINQKPVTIDFLGALGYYGIGVFVRYSPFNTFRNCAGLDFKSFSTGIMLFL